jgi:uncharacterized protein (DUF1015 family)
LLDASLSETARWLNVAVLAAALRELLGIDAGVLAAGGRVSYTQDAADAVGRVQRGDGASAFLLDPTPVAAVTKIAAAGEVMPQKSTFFFPKAPTGIAFAPLEW